MAKIEYETQSDRELLIAAIDKINTVDEKLDSVCGNISEHDDKINDINEDIAVLKDNAKTNKWVIRSTVTLLIGLIIAVFSGVLRRIGLG